MDIASLSVGQKAFIVVGAFCVYFVVGFVLGRTAKWIINRWC
ncbi:hypothetical protein [Campylobacter sp.]|nr:hypothetical protein [Campylobacter sp.]